MTTTTIVELVAGFVVVDVAVMYTLARTGVLRSWKQVYENIFAQMRAKAEERNETIVRGPTLVRYSGATGGGFSGVHNRAAAILTSERLAMQTRRGTPMDLARGAIESVRAEKWFRGSATVTRTHVVLRMKEGFEIGFSVPEEEATGWIHDIETMLGGGEPASRSSA